MSLIVWEKNSLGADGSGLKTTRVFILTNEHASGESQQISVGAAGSRTCWEASSTREEKTCFPTRGGSEEEQQQPADKITDTNSAASKICENHPSMMSQRALIQFSDHTPSKVLALALSEHLPFLSLLKACCQHRAKYPGPS